MVPNNGTTDHIVWSLDNDEPLYSFLLKTAASKIEADFSVLPVQGIYDFYWKVFWVEADILGLSKIGFFKSFFLIIKERGLLPKLLSFSVLSLVAHFQVTCTVFQRTIHSFSPSGGMCRVKISNGCILYVLAVTMLPCMKCDSGAGCYA